MIYFGVRGGRWVEVACPSVQRVSGDERYRFATTLEGRRKAQVVPGGRRVWDVTLPRTSTPDQVATLMDFVSGAWGDGPFVFVPADAPNTNMLTAGVAAGDPAAGISSVNEPDGPLLTADGWAPRSLVRVNPPGHVHFGGETTDGAAPVIPGQPVTASAYVSGPGAAVQVAWRDRDGVFMSADESSVQGAVGGPAIRSHLTATPPDGAVWASVRAVNTIRGARPAITWSDRVLPFADGRLASRVVVDQVSSDLVHTLPGRTYQSLSFTVTEVG